METRTITQVRIYTLALNPMTGRAEERRIVALSTDYNKLVAWYNDQLAPEPWHDRRMWCKVFRAGSPLEWFNPAYSLELNQTGPYRHGIGDMWIPESEWPVLRSCGYYTIIK